MKYLQWVPTSARMPDAELAIYQQKWGSGSYLEVISFISGAVVPTVLGYDGRGFFVPDPEEYDELDREYYAVTHWMVMPPAPRECIVNLELGDQIEANFDLLEAFLT